MMSNMILLVLVCVISTHAQRIVDTEYGQVRGHVINVDNGREQTTVDVFYAIPFAKPPVGTLRFASPVKADPWTGILEADTLGSACPQDGGLLQTSIPDWTDIAEDCLHLNIITPTGVGPYPVMVWMYGGGYQIGANMQYPGHFLASRGVVVAVVNYRVNKFGYAYTGNAACPGNAGMLDQTMGLQFVVDNIANFGGDPSKITVFGESAGGTSTSLHVISPMSNDLFQQAIIQSGSEMNFWAVNPPASNPQDYTYQLATDLDCTRPDDFQMMDCLRDLSWQEVLENSTIRCTPGFICLGMAPVVDGPGGFLPQEPDDLRASGDVMSGPIISGINREDGSIFAPVFAPAIVLDGCCNRTYFSHVLENKLVGYFESRISNVTSEQVYRAVDFMYTPWPHLYDEEMNRGMLVEMVTDAAFGVFWDRQLKEHSAIAPTYGYMYDHMTDNATTPLWMGTPHGAEVGSLWGFPLMSFNEEVRNDGGYEAPNSTASDVEYSIFIQELWTNFAKFGNPTPSPVSNPLGGSTVWPMFDDEELSVFYLGDTHIQTEMEWRQKNYAFWNDYLIWMAGEELGIGDDWPPQGMVSDLLIAYLEAGLGML